MLRLLAAGTYERLMIGAVASVAILLAAASLHVYWGAGGSWGKGAAIPERNGRRVLNPSPAAIYAVAVCLALAAMLIAMCAGLLPSAGLASIPRFAAWALAIIFLARGVGDFRYVGFFKRVRGTRFALLDSAVYSPLCCLLALLIADAAYVAPR